MCALAMMAMVCPTVVHALTPPQSAAASMMKAKADAAAKSKAQSLIRARTDALAQKAKADAAAKTKAVVGIKQGLRLEAKRRTEAAGKAARLHRQILRTAWAGHAAEHPHHLQPHMARADRHEHHAGGHERHHDKPQRHATRSMAHR
jgi:hypothetical protein